jgi:hypothetical protein
MIRKILAITATALPLLAFALTPSSASAQSFTGNWPATVSGSGGSNGTECITLVDNGSIGRPHSGQASFIFENNKLFGTFQVINNFIAITIQTGGGNGEGAGVVYTAPVSNGDIRKGVFEAVFGGNETDSGAVAFGVKNSCSN